MKHDPKNLVEAVAGGDLVEAVDAEDTAAIAVVIVADTVEIVVVIVADAEDTEEIVADAMSLAEADDEEGVVVDAEIAAIDTKQLVNLSSYLERQGLIYLGCVSPDTREDFQKYQNWLKAGFHGSLNYLEKNQDCRKSASAALDGAKSVIVFALPYAPSQEESYPAPVSEEPRIAAYARIPDYHVLMKQLALVAIEDWKGAVGESAYQWRVCVDTVPILERAFAQKTGLGFIGKNTCFIHEEKGSFLLLGEIITNATFHITEKTNELGCGSCNLCQAECPTGALQNDYQIDSRKCLSYWTIEQRGPIPEEFWPGVAQYWFGCDICQLVCPFNRQAKNNTLPKAVTPLEFPSLFEVATMNETQYRKYFGGTALTRAKRNGLRRNALIAMTVNQHPKLQQALDYSTNDREAPIAETLVQIKNYLARVTR